MPPERAARRAGERGADEPRLADDLREEDAKVDAMSGHDARLSSPLRTLAVSGAVVTGLVALWLFSVVAAVLPARDPQHVPMWAGVATALLGYAALTLVFLSGRSRSAWLRSAVYWGAVGTIAFGAYVAYAMIQAQRTGAAFEGYLLLMGAILAVQGVCTLAYALNARAS
jgi:hypothetical protein